MYNDKTEREHPHAYSGTETVEKPVPAMAYVPIQKFERLYKNEDALCAGTLFADLDKPFYGKGVR